MLENALALRNTAYKKRITYKTLVSAGLIALAVLLPQFVHLALGQSGGVQWLPMYLPVLIGGCLLGSRWALSVGLLSPLVSFIITSLLGDPMPMAARLPFMMVELAVFAFVAGLFSDKITKNGLWAFAAVILAQISGRAVFLALVALFQNFIPFTPALIWSQIQAGFIGLGIQAALVPVIIIILRRAMIKDRGND